MNNIFVGKNGNLIITSFFVDLKEKINLQKSQNNCKRKVKYKISFIHL